MLTPLQTCNKCYLYTGTKIFHIDRVVANIYSIHFGESFSANFWEVLLMQRAGYIRICTFIFNKTFQE